MYDWEKNIKIKKDYFLYKGNAYSYKENLKISKNYELIDQETNKSIKIYNNYSGAMEDFISEEALYKIKIKYVVGQMYYEIETFDTREEAEYFIDIVTTRE